MENINLSHQPGKGFHIEDFPDAVKLIALKDGRSKRLADLALHHSDLKYVIDCLNEINNLGEDCHIVRTSLWQSSITQFIKCFGENKSRFNLDLQKVFKNDIGAIEAFYGIKALRNKHIVHDENSYSQCISGAVLNADYSSFKVAKIICFAATIDTLSQDFWSNLMRLTTETLKWVTMEFDLVCVKITTDLEARDYTDLLAMDSVTYSKPQPGIDTLTSKRKKY